MTALISALASVLLYSAKVLATETDEGYTKTKGAVNRSRGVSLPCQRDSFDVW